MKATKGNKTYTITEQDKRRYMDAGYDIQSDTGETIVYGRGRTVALDMYMELEKKYKDLGKLHEELAGRCRELEEQLAACGVEAGEETDNRDISAMSVEELTAYAAEKQIDLGKSTSRDGILEKIRAALKKGG